MKFVCKNKACAKFDVVDEYLTNHYRMVNGKLQSDNAPCPECGQIREEINPYEDIPWRERNISIGKYASSDKQGKREMLKKRSHEHYEKEIKPFKEFQLNETVKRFKEASKG